MLSQITRLAATSPKLRRAGSCLCRKLRLELLSLRLHLVFPLSHRIARGDEHHFCMVRFARIQRAAKMQRHVAEAIAWQQAPGLRTCRRHSLFLQILSALSQGMPSRLLVASWWQLAAFDAFFLPRRLPLVQMRSECKKAARAKQSCNLVSNVPQFCN